MRDRQHRLSTTAAGERPAFLPLACTLDTANGRERARQWQDLARRAYLATRREPDAVVWQFRNLPGVREKADRLAAAEHDCCPFLAFHVASGGGTVIVRITAAPGAAPDVAAELARLAPALVPAEHHERPR
jgi:hypothetical protein